MLLVDGHGVAYRAYYAIPSLSSPAGEPTNAVYGFIKMFNRLRNEVKPNRLAVVWDGGLSAARVNMHPAYKATRPPMPESLRTQLPRIMQFLGHAGATSLRRDGVEADDLIAALALAGRDNGMEVVIASNDKDFWQLVCDRISVVAPGERALTWYGPEQVRDRTGVWPAQIVDYLSLVGDSVDNIPGVPGVGPKTASRLLAQFGSVDQLYAQLDEVRPDRLRHALAESRDVVWKNRELIGFRPEWVGPVTVSDLDSKAPDLARLRTFYEELGFRSLIKELGNAAEPEPDLFGHSVARFDA